LKKKGLLVILVLIFLCACTFIDGREKDTLQHEEVQLLQDYDEIVKRAESYASQSTDATVESVYQHESDSIWKIEFTNGLVILYDETTNEITHTEE
jgi:hypothetical protein